MSESYRLTPREKEVLEKLCLGLSIKEIAEHFQRSPSTVEKQVRSAREALGARNKEQAVMRAIKANLLEL